jgi:acyl-CoA thioester hydrolase
MPLLVYAIMHCIPITYIIWDRLYLRPARYDDELEIVTTLREKPIARIRLDYEIFRAAELLATGHTVHAFIDREGRPTRPPANFAGKMAELFRP